VVDEDDYDDDEDDDDDDDDDNDDANLTTCTQSKRPRVDLMVDMCVSVVFGSMPSYNVGASAECLQTRKNTVYASNIQIGAIIDMMIARLVLRV